MPNHFHFLVRIKEEREIIETFPKLQKNANKDLQGFQNLGGLISKQFSNFFNSYSKAFNKIFARQGSLFNQNFKRKKLTTEQYLKQAIVYIHLNPVKHKFVEKLQDRKYSSYNAVLSTKSSSIKKKAVIELFADLQNFRVYHEMKAAEMYSSKMEVEY